MDNIDELCSGNKGTSFSFLSHITITNPEGQSQLCDVMLSAMPTNLFAEDVKDKSSKLRATPTKEAVQPPLHCLLTVNNPAPLLSVFYPHEYHTKVSFDWLEFQFS